MSSSNCCFLTCIYLFSGGRSSGLVFQSLEEFSTVCCDPQSQTLWHSQWSRGRCFFWDSLAFSMFQCMLVIWSLVPLPFLNPAWTFGSSWFTYCWTLAWRILSITLLACEFSAIVWYFGHSLALPFLGIGMKTEIFQPCGHRWVFQIFWHIEFSTLTASSFGFEIAQLEFHHLH